MVSGTLSLKFIKVENAPAQADEGLAGYNFTLKVRVNGEAKSTSPTGKGHEKSINQTLNFDLKDVTGNEDVNVEFHIDGKKKATAAVKTTLADFLQHQTATVKTLELKNNLKIDVEAKWTVKNATQKVAGEGAAHAAEQVKETAASVATMNPQRALAVHETHRPWFMRVSYYYDTTKNVYNYTTSFRLISSVARFGENTTNAVLEKITGKKLVDLDQKLVAPTLVTLDDKVDETISAVLVKLVQGQNFVIQKKNDVVDTASTITKKSSEQISNVVGSTLTTVGKAKDYTTAQIKSVSSSAIGTAVSVKDYTTSQVVNVSSSAYGTVRGATVYVVSHLPYLGAKVRA